MCLEYLQSPGAGALDLTYFAREPAYKYYTYIVVGAFVNGGYVYHLDVELLFSFLDEQIYVPDAFKRASSTSNQAHQLFAIIRLITRICWSFATPTHDVAMNESC
jgi:hypothetical protein